LAGMSRVLRSGHVIEFGIAAITAATVVAWGVEQGVILAIVLSIVAHLRHSYNPQNLVLGTDGSHWEDVPVDPVPQPAPGLVVFPWGGSLYFANAARLAEQVTSLVQSEPPVEWICVDGVAMGDVDYTGGETLIQVNNKLKESGARLLLASVSPA